MNSYTPIAWRNGITPLNATNMNHIEQGISYLYQYLAESGAAILGGDESLNALAQIVGNPAEETPAPAENEVTQCWAAAFGKSNKSTNYASFTTGTRNENNGDSAFVTGVGNETTAYGMCSLTFGEGNENASRDSLVGGYYNTSASDVNANLVVGTLLQADNDNQHIIGTANELKTGLRFAIGNGTYGIDPVTYEPINIQRANAFEVYKNGSVIIPEGLFTAAKGCILKDTGGTERLSIADTSGIIGVTAHLVPTVNNVRNLGASDARWSKGYITELHTTSIYNSFNTEKIFLGSAGVEMKSALDAEYGVYLGYNNTQMVVVNNATDIKVKAQLLPYTIGTYDIGSPSLHWGTLYANHLGGTSNYVTDACITSLMCDTLGASNHSVGSAYIANVITTSIKDSGNTERIEVSATGTVKITGHIAPDNNNTRNIGTSSKAYKEVFAMKLCDNASNEVTLKELKDLVAYAKAQGWIS